MNYYGSWETAKYCKECGGKLETVHTANGVKLKED
jgi:putative hemolysin